MGYKKAKGRTDFFQTPDYAIQPIIEFIPKNYKIWEPACATGNIVNYFSRIGYSITGTDITNQINFFSSDMDCDCIITNPPYSIKDKWIERCYTLGKPFMLLLPLTALEGKYRQSIYRKNGVEIILMNKRINYETPSGKGKGAWFASAWFTYGFNMKNQITFLEI